MDSIEVKLLRIQVSFLQARNQNLEKTASTLGESLQNMMSLMTSTSRREWTEPIPHEIKYTLDELMRSVQFMENLLESGINNNDNEVQLANGNAKKQKTPKKVKFQLPKSDCNLHIKTVKKENFVEFQDTSPNHKKKLKRIEVCNTFDGVKPSKVIYADCSGIARDVSIPIGRRLAPGSTIRIYRKANENALGCYLLLKTSKAKGIGLNPNCNIALMIYCGFTSEIIVWNSYSRRKSWETEVNQTARLPMCSCKMIDMEIECMENNVYGVKIHGVDCFRYKSPISLEDVTHLEWTWGATVSTVTLED